MNKCEEELSNCKLQLTENQSQLTTVEAKMTLEQTKNSELKNELEMNKKAEDEKIEILNLNLAEVKNVAETQKNELQYLKSELEKEMIKKITKKRKISQKIYRKIEILPKIYQENEEYHNEEFYKKFKQN